MVTGATGFLGSYIVKDLLQQGFHVIGLYRNEHHIPLQLLKPVPGSNNSITWLQGDILDIYSLQDAIAQVDYVVHAAAKVSFAKKDKRSLYKTNIDGTCNVVNICLEKNVQRFVYISSVAALGRTSETKLITENTKWVADKANTHYAISKFKAEIEVWRAFAEGLPGVILNPTTILGFGNWEHSSNRIFKQVHKGFDWYTTGGNGFTGVEDVAHAVSLVLNSTINHERFIINTSNWPYKKLQDTIAIAFGKSVPTKKATLPILWAALVAEKIKSLFTGHTAFLTSETIKVAMGTSLYSSENLLNALPGFQYKPLELAIEEAVQQYKKSYD